MYIHIVPKEVRSSQGCDDYYDKYYVGITSKSLSRRWGKNGNGYKNQAFGVAIQKYGWNNIQHELIAENLTKSEAAAMEAKLINTLGSYKGGFGYNRAYGGILEGIDVKKDLTGMVFGRLTVLGNDPTNSSNVICQCSCEAKTIKPIDRYNLLNGHINSCGCLQRELAAKNHMTHNLSDTKIYRQWQSIKDMCYNPNNKDYSNNGLIGIIMFKQWKNDFMSFYNWSIENGYDEVNNNRINRIDKTKNWSPDNCQWITIKQKCANRSDAMLYTYNGKTQNLNDWSKELGIGRLTLRSRIVNQGMSVKQAFETPVNGKGSPLDQRAKKYTYNDETHSLREWADIYELHLKKIRNRISRDKWSIKKTLDYYLKGSEING